MKHTLKDAYIYDLLDLDKVVSDIGIKINPNIDKYRITPDQLNMVINDFKYKASGYGKERILTLLASGKIILINAQGITLPAWCMMDNGEVVAVVNIFSKVRTNRDGNLAYQVKELFGLTIVGYVLRSFFKNEKKIMFNTQYIVALGSMYTRMVNICLDSMFAVSADKTAATAVGFLIIRFYLRRVMECTYSEENELSMILNVMRSLTKGQISGNVTDIVEGVKTFPDDAYANIDTFMKALSSHFSVLSRLETNLFIRKMITSFGEKSVLMLESPQYLTAYIISSFYSANLLKDYYVSSIIPTEIGTKVITTFFNTDSNPNE